MALKDVLFRLNTGMGVSWLMDDEWISLQIKDGPCSAGCSYCYGINELITEAEKLGIHNNSFSISELMKKIPNKNLEMSQITIIEILSYLKDLGIKCINLIGSEPTEHTQFKSILDIMLNYGINASVYTNGRNIDKLLHLAVSRIILHITFFPDDKYMTLIKKLIDMGVYIDLRVNFSSKEIIEGKIINSFLSKLSGDDLQKILIKYSVTSRVPQQGIEGFNLNNFYEIKQPLLNFLNELHNKFPQVKFFSERTLFRCCFSDEELKKYSFANIVFKCSMEFTIYKDRYMRFCSPGILAIKGYIINSPNDIVNSIEELRKEVNRFFLFPSFKECLDCLYRINLECYGGCIGYKL